MSSTFQVDTAQIAGAAGDINRISAEIEASVRAMMSRLLSLQDAWQGAAATNFQGVVRDWDGVQRRVRESLDTISQALNRAGQQYAEVERANASMFNV
ncbi:MAG TPA: WXG100 family type VII secretion target [Dermatophilaceae bacterium]|nr:WXG100 family type VII secretion target [Dermatophilaceae bacterium]